MAFLRLRRWLSAESYCGEAGSWSNRCIPEFQMRKGSAGGRPRGRRLHELHHQGREELNIPPVDELEVVAALIVGGFLDVERLI